MPYKEQTQVRIRGYLEPHTITASIVNNNVRLYALDNDLSRFYKEYELFIYAGDVTLTEYCGVDLGFSEKMTDDIVKVSSYYKGDFFKFVYDELIKIYNSSEFKDVTLQSKFMIVVNTYMDNLIGMIDKLENGSEDE